LNVTTAFFDSAVRSAVSVQLAGVPSPTLGAVPDVSTSEMGGVQTISVRVAGGAAGAGAGTGAGTGTGAGAGAGAHFLPLPPHLRLSPWRSEPVLNATTGSFALAPPHAARHKLSAALAPKSIRSRVIEGLTASGRLFASLSIQHSIFVVSADDVRRCALAAGRCVNQHTQTVRGSKARERPHVQTARRGAVLTLERHGATAFVLIRGASGRPSSHLSAMRFVAPRARDLRLAGGERNG